MDEVAARPGTTVSGGEFSGFLPARFWLDLTTALAGREIVDVSGDFNEMMLPKSDDELVLVRAAASAAEAAGQAMLDVVAPRYGRGGITAGLAGGSAD